ncbi:hypothetical protein YC2023_102101 [Brassica napus]
MHERLSGGSGENVASEHIGNSVSDLRVDQPEWLSDERTKTLTDLSGGYLRYMQVSAFDGGEDWSNYGREILTTSLTTFQGCYTRFLDLRKQRDSKAWKVLSKYLRREKNFDFSNESTCKPFPEFIHTTSPKKK